MQLIFGAFGVLAATAFLLLSVQFEAAEADAMNQNHFQEVMRQDRLDLAESAPLRPDQIEWGRIAWRYFEQNVDKTTGLPDSVAGYPASALWEIGSYLLGVVAAERIGVVDRAVFNDHVTRALASLQKIPLFEGRIPNKVYNVRTLAMVDYSNAPAPEGIGYSPLDIARLLLALSVIERGYPDFATQVNRVIARWDLSLLVKDAQLQGASRENGKTRYYQEGRLGYEQYAARILSSYYLNVRSSLHEMAWAGFIDVLGQRVPYDRRDKKTYHASSYTLSDPYVLMAMEWGLDDISHAFSDRIYLAQSARFRKDGILTSLGEGHINRPPHFLYVSVVANGMKWAVLDPSGVNHEELRFFSTKIAFCYDAIYGDEYSGQLVAKAVELNDPKGGWLVGRFEKGGLNDAQSADTNGMILQSLHYRSLGPMTAYPFRSIR